MKKIFYCLFAVFISSVIMLCSVSCGQGKGVAVVGKEKITESDIAERKQCHEVMNYAFGQVMYTALSADKVKEYLEKYNLPTEDSEVLEDLIRGAVIRKQLEDDALSYKQCNEKLLEEYKNLNEDVYTTAINNSLSRSDISEDDFLKLAADYAYDYFNEVKLKESFSENDYDGTAGTTLDEQFSEYVDKLIKEASVKYNK